MKSWDHLPNAKHIARVLASFSVNPTFWVADCDNTILSSSWESVAANTDAVLGDEYDSAVSPIYDLRAETTYENRFAAYSAIRILVSYDDIAYMLDSDPVELEILAAVGDVRAALMLPASKAFAMEKARL